MILETKVCLFVCYTKPFRHRHSPGSIVSAESVFYNQEAQKQPSCQCLRHPRGTPGHTEGLAAVLTSDLILDTQHRRVCAHILYWQCMSQFLPSFSLIESASRMAPCNVQAQLGCLLFAVTAGN